ncbi:hypothetical protein ABMA70_05890 [Halobacteriovorax sp. XZX-3]|uniref:hypothetical protein n=1 Tax=unclassified Halobacteriovorax TaxID=2639665 RepID=UPI000CD0C37A|nr:hypothetical protein [Halobacteriovorax sp. DA5]POB14976.1 hypothetical protein C0Z22_00955 [Halobacteriovorax sp. DA5]
MFRLLFATFILAQFAFANDICPSNKDVKKVAAQLVEIEMSGIRLIDGAKDDCLKSKYQKYYRFNKDPDYDAPKSLQYLATSEKAIKISDVKLIDKDVHAYEANYSVNVEDLKGKKSVVKDSIRFYINVSKRAQQGDGCASVIEPAKKLILLKSCKK